MRVPLIGKSILRILILTSTKGRLSAPVMRLVVGLDRIFIQRSGSITTGHHLQSSKGHLVLFVGRVLGFAVRGVTTLIHLANIDAI